MTAPTAPTPLQKAVCDRYGLPVLVPDEMIAVALATLGRSPIYGTRIALPEGGNVSWFIHCGDYDAWATWDPYTTIATTQSQAKVLVSGNQLLSNHLYLAATRQAIADKRLQLDDFVARIDRAYRWTNAHPEAYAAALARVTGLPLEVHLAVARATHIEPVAIDAQVIAGLQATADIYREEGLLLRPIDVSQGFDPSFNTPRPQLNQASR